MKTVLLYSGGIDSTVLLYDLLKEGDEVIPFAVDYGQSHRRELRAAKDITDALGLKLDVVNIELPWLATGEFPLVTDGTHSGPFLELPWLAIGEFPLVPDGSQVSGAVTIVPGRNTIFLALAASIAETRYADRVAIACTASDYEVYPDCRPQYLEATDAVFSFSHLHVYHPFSSYLKAAVVEHGDKLGAPLGETWSCYLNGWLHCGQCGACTERRKAFADAVISDPTVYRPLRAGERR